MLFKYFSSYVSLLFMVLMGLLPNRGHTQPHTAMNDSTGTFHEDCEYKNPVRFNTMYAETDLWRHQSNLAVTQPQPRIGKGACTQSLLLKTKTSYRLGEDVYVFSALRYDSAGFDEYYHSSAAAGIGRTLLDNGNLRLDLDMGAGSSINKLLGSAATEDSIVRMGLTFTSQPTAGTLLRQDLVIESSRSHTSTESMTTWSYAMNPKLALEVLFAVRKSSSLPADSLDVQRRALFSLNYAF